MIGAVELVKNTDINIQISTNKYKYSGYADKYTDKYKYSGYSIVYSIHGTFSFATGWFCYNVIIFPVDMSSPAHVDSKKKDILILGEGPTQGLDDKKLTGEKKYSISFTESRKKIWLN